MTRKLHNTLMAAITSSSLLIVGLIASSPTSTVVTHLSVPNTTSVLASIDSQVDIASDVIDQAESAPIQRAHVARHSRQSLAMPFFSFAPRS